MHRKAAFHLFFRFFIPILVSFLIYVFIIFGLLIPYFSDSLISQKKLQCQENIQLAHSILKWKYDLCQKGVISEKQAKEEAIDFFRNIRSGPEGNDYFWINDKDGIFIMHPYLEEGSPEYRQKVQKFFSDNVIDKIREIISSNKEGFVKYRWFSKESPDAEIEKISYVEEFEPWKWDVGTGLYIEKEKAQVELLIREQLVILFGALLFIVMVYLFMLWQARNTENELADAVKALEASERKYRDLFEKIGDAFMLHDLDHTIVNCNNAGMKLMRCSASNEIEGKNISEFWAENQPDGENSIVKAKRMVKEALSLGSKRLEWLFVRKDGSPFEGEVLITVLVVNNKKMIHTVIRDITERKNNERKIAEYQEHLEELVAERTRDLENSNDKLNQELEEHKKLENDIRQILNSSDSAMRVIGLDKHILYANNMYSQMVGVDKDKVLGSVCHEISCDQNGDLSNCNLKHLLKVKKSFERETVKILPDGKKVILAVTCAPYIDPKGNIIGMVETYTDITEKVLAQEAQEREALNKGRMDMANNILHDIGNAVTGIGVASIKLAAEHEWQEINSINSLLTFFSSKRGELEGALGEERAANLIEYLEALIGNLKNREENSKELFLKISKSISHINSILNMQRIYAKGDFVTTREFDIRRIIDDAIFMMSSSFEKRHVEVSTDFPPVKPVICGDHTRIMQVFLNLLNNSVDAFDASHKKEDGNRFLKISIKDIPETNKVRIVSEDNATGFDPAFAEKFFEKGYSSKEDESGLGLYECRAIIESHGGSIVMSSEGEGSTTKVIIEMEKKSKLERGNSK